MDFSQVQLILRATGPGVQQVGMFLFKPNKILDVFKFSQMKVIFLDKKI